MFMLTEQDQVDIEDTLNKIIEIEDFGVALLYMFDTVNKIKERQLEELQ